MSVHHEKQPARRPLPGLLSILLAAGLCFGCGTTNDDGPVTGELAGKADVASADLAKQVQGNNTLAFTLYHHPLFAKKGENFVFSPYSMSSALAMTYAGAQDETAKEMAQTLHLLSQKKTHPVFGYLKEELQARERASDSIDPNAAVELRIANAIFRQEGYPFLQSFIDVLETSYGVDGEDKEFIKQFLTQPDKSREEINEWVELQTKDKIKDLLPAGSIKPQTRAVLTNAIYFKGGWATFFQNPDDRPDDPNYCDAADRCTKPADFFPLGSPAPVKVSMMRATLKKTGYYAEPGQYQAISLPYRGHELEMLVVVPDQGAFEAVSGSLDPQLVESITGKLSEHLVYLRMPKFSFTAEPQQVKDTLKDLGMKRAFEQSQAQFFGMYDYDPPKTDILYISDVLHKAFIGVDEKGTEAAAATAVIMMERTVVRPPENQVSLTIDRPFLFLIRDRITGTILFIGQVLQPDLVESGSAAS